MTAPDPAPDPTPTSLLALARALTGDEATRAAYLDDPGGFLAARGLGDLTANDLATALPHLADALPPALAAAVIGDAPSWVDAADPHDTFAALAALDVDVALARWAERIAPDPEDPLGDTGLDGLDPADGLDDRDGDLDPADLDATGLDATGLDATDPDPADLDAADPDGLDDLGSADPDGVGGEGPEPHADTLVGPGGEPAPGPTAAVSPEEMADDFGWGDASGPPPVPDQPVTIAIEPADDALDAGVHDPWTDDALPDPTFEDPDTDDPVADELGADPVAPLDDLDG